MTVEIDLIRHGKTAGNLEKRYIGRTDEPLCPEGVRELQGRVCRDAPVWFLSPMRRCVQTAVVLRRALRENRPGENVPKPEEERALAAAADVILVPDFRECDFGLFENRNYRELVDCPQYQQWIDSGGTLPFPGGEAVEAFKERCCRAFAETAQRILDNGWPSANLVVHGGTVMSIMERFARPRKTYYDWQAENGGGYRIWLEETLWREQRQFARAERL